VWVLVSLLLPGSSLPSGGTLCAKWEIPPQPRADAAYQPWILAVDGDYEMMIYQLDLMPELVCRRAAKAVGNAQQVRNLPPCFGG